MQDNHNIELDINLQPLVDNAVEKIMAQVEKETAARIKKINYAALISSHIIKLSRLIGKEIFINDDK